MPQDDSSVTVACILKDIPQEYIDKRIADAAAFVHSVEIEELNARYNIALTKRICNKTGLLLENRNPWHIAQAIAMWGEEEAIALLRRENTANCAIHWVKTGPTQLDALMLSDPRSYFVYAASAICANYSPLADFPNHLLQKWQQKGVKSERYAEYTIAAYEYCYDRFLLRTALEAQPLEAIIPINETMRQYLAVFEAKNIDHYDKKWAASLYTDECDTILNAIGADPVLFHTLLKGTMRAIISDAFAHGKLSYDADYNQLNTMRKLYGGYGNFAGQFNPRGLTETERFQASMADIAFDADIPDDRNKRLQSVNIAMAQGKIVIIDRNYGKAEIVKGTVTFSFGLITVAAAPAPEAPTAAQIIETEI